MGVDKKKAADRNTKIRTYLNEIAKYGSMYFDGLITLDDYEAVVMTSMDALKSLRGEA